MPEAWYAGVGVEGPLATFEGAPVWTRYPYRDGVVLIGDAAGQADPTFGCGMSLTMRDVRVLSDLLKEDADWRAAAERYAVEHNRYYQALHIIESWATEYITGEGPGFDQFRAQADQLWSQGLGPDFICVGPDLPPDRLALLQLPGH